MSKTTKEVNKEEATGTANKVGLGAAEKGRRKEEEKEKEQQGERLSELD